MDQCTEVWSFEAENNRQRISQEDESNMIRKCFKENQNEIQAKFGKSFYMYKPR